METSKGIERELSRVLLKHAVQRAMFCQAPACGAILDVDRAVLLDASETRGGMMIMCASCWDRLSLDGRDRARRHADVTDGREFKAGSPKKAPKKAPKVPKVGEVWTTRAGSRVVRVRLDGDRGVRTDAHGRRDLKRWACTSLVTGRSMRRSTAALRERAS